MAPLDTTQEFPAAEAGHGACSAADSSMLEAETSQAIQGLSPEGVQTPEDCGEAAIRSLKPLGAVQTPEDRIATVLRRYSLKLYPNASQLVAIERQSVLCVHLWNAANDQRVQQMRQESQRKAKGERKFLTYFDQARELKHVRASDPEFAGMHSSTIEGVIKRLDLAWQAFWKGRKAGRDNGPPRFKASALADTVPFRDAPKGYRIAPAGKNFKITMKGIPGAVKARGCFPPGVHEHRDMTLMKRDGAWFASIVVKIEPRRAPGPVPLEVAFDLIDQFAAVKSANGECFAGLSDPFSDGRKGESPQHPKGFSHIGCGDPADAGGQQVSGHHQHGIARCGDPADAADEVQSIGDRRFKKFSLRWKREKRRVARIRARAARQRAHALHVWSSALTRLASALTVTAPARLKDQTASGRGDERNWGAAVETKAELNKSILQTTPASAIAMLAYKAGEAGIPFVLIEDESPAIAVGNDLVATAKSARRAARIIKKELAA